MTIALPPTKPDDMRRGSPLWRYAPALAILGVLWLLVTAALFEPVNNWLRGEDTYDEAAVQEWLEEARGFRDTLPEMIDTYVKGHKRVIELQDRPPFDVERDLAMQAESIRREE